MDFSDAPLNMNQNRDHIIINMPQEMDVENADDLNIGIPQGIDAINNENDADFVNNRGNVHNMNIKYC